MTVHCFIRSWMQVNLQTQNVLSLKLYFQKLLCQMASIVHNILLCRFQSNTRNFLHIPQLFISLNFLIIFQMIGTVNLNTRFLHTFHSSFLWRFAAGVCLVINDFWFPITPGQGLLHHFCADLTP